jgi:PAS domain S-box-containing protein
MSNNSNSDQTLESYKLIFESSLDAILLTHPDGTIFYANSAAEELYGYTQQEICDLGRSGIVDMNDPNLQVILDERARLGKSKGELTLIKKDGSKFPAEISTSIFKDKNDNINTFMTIRDISERKMAEESLEESEERYHSLFDNNHAVMLLIDPDSGDIIDVNPAATSFYGYNSDELIKMNINDINILSNEEIYDNMQKSVSSQQNHFLFKHRLASGEIRDVDVYSGTYDVGGKKILYSIIHDVTDRIIAQDKLKESNEELQSTTKELQVTNEELHQQEEKLLQTYNELKSSEERFRSIIENIQDAYIRTDKEGTIIMASPSAARMYRFNSTQEMIGTTTPSYFKNSEDRDYAIEKLKKHGKFNDYEVEARRNDGTFFWVSQNAQYYYDDQGKIQGRETIVRDITARKVMETALKKSERSLAEAQHIAHIGSWEWNLKTDNINWSNELYSIYGVDPNTFTPTLSSFADYMHPDDEEYVNQSVDQLLSECKSHSFDFRIILDDGTIRVLNTIAEVTEFDKNEKPSIIVGINQDITERKEIELKLNENIKKLAQSNNELEQFAYITSHDLCEPLRMITSFLQLLERRYKDQLDQDANEFIRFAVDGAKRLDAMTNDLLQYSRITSEKREVTSVNLEHVLEHVLTNLKMQIEENNAVITHDPLPILYGDEKLKVQLFQNIISNAIKYRSQETPKIHISATKMKNQYLFSVKDNGIGMSPKYLEQIFTIFKRLHTHEEYEGTGIGLAIAQKIVHQQGGQIWVESEPGKGSTFYFTIPIN